MSDETTTILKEVKAFAEAWNKGDAQAAASFFTEDGVRVGAMGDKQNGRAEIEAAYERLLSESMPGAVVEQEEGEVRMLTPEFAVIQAGIKIIFPDKDSPIKGHVVQVMKKVDDRWLILEAHPKLFP